MNSNSIIDQYGKLKNTIRLAEKKTAELRPYILNYMKRSNVTATSSYKYAVTLTERTNKRLDEQALRAKFGDDVIDQYVVVSNVDVLNVNKIK